MGGLWRTTAGLAVARQRHAQHSQGSAASAEVCLCSPAATCLLPALSCQQTYGVGEAEAVSNVVLGNLLVLPTTIAWLAFMDAVNLFEVAPVSGAGAKKPAACTACKYYI